jgi:uncharacterized membrane protein YheB (UPF0754 family)
MIASEMKRVSTEKISEFVKRAISMLIQNQVSDTLILSSYKINTVVKNHLGKDFKVERIGRCLAKIAKQNKLKRIHTKIPKYELRKSKFRGFQNPD